MKIPTTLGVGLGVALVLGLPLLSPASAEVVPTVIQSNFNGTDIDAGNYIWFHNHFKYTGSTTHTCELRFDNAVISFTADGTNYNLSVPSGAVILSTTATEATTIFDEVGNQWITTVPASEGGDIFMQGLGYQVPVDFPGGINPVVWSADFSTDCVGACAKWQWGAAVYTDFSSDNDALGVVSVDGGFQAGTPENFTAFVTGGARGGGGSNFTGSNSGTKEACSEQPVSVDPAHWGVIKSAYR